MTEGPSEADRLLELVRTPGIPMSPVLPSAAQSGGAISLAEYRQVVSAWPPPERHQIEAFAQYVSAAHSWYKHLPMVPPGTPFVFVVNPCAMMLDTPPRFEDRRSYSPYVSEEQRFHYSTMLTAEYREKFGWLDYYDGGRGAAIPIPTRPSDVILEARVRSVPREIHDACTVCLTAAVYPMTASQWWMLLRLVNERADGEQWPVESGGPGRFKRVLEICRANYVKGETHSELAELFRTERERQIREIEAAIERLRALLWG